MTFTTAAPEGGEDAFIDGPDNLMRMPTVKHWELNRWYEKPSQNLVISVPANISKVKAGPSGAEWDWTDCGIREF
jgi:hypothetical protein